MIDGGVGLGHLTQGLALETDNGEKKGRTAHRPPLGCRVGCPRSADPAFAPGLDELVVVHRLALRLIVGKLGLRRTRLVEPFGLVDFRIELRPALA